MSKDWTRRWDRAHKLFRKLWGRKPQHGEVQSILEPLGEDGDRDLIFQMGTLSAVTYIAPDGKAYYHEFASNNRPALFVNNDGKQLYIFGGKYKVTQQGIDG